MNIKKGLAVSALGLALITGLSACGDEDSAPAKTIQPEVTEKPIKEPAPTVTPMEKLPRKGMDAPDGLKSD